MTSSRVALVAVCLLGACGGDDGPGDPPPDTTSPTVVSSTPADGAADIWLRDPIEITFSERLDEASITAEAVQVSSGGSAIPAALGRSADSTVVMVLVEPDAAAFGSVQVSLGEGLRDRAGNRLTATTLSFRLEAWQRPSSGLDRGASPARHAIATGPGATVMAWQVGAAGSRRIVVSRLVGDTWTALGAELGAGDAQAPAITLDADGGTVVAWAQVGATSTIEAARWDGTAWRGLPSPGALELRPGVGQAAVVIGPALATATGGPTAIAWSSGVSPNRVIVQELAVDAWRAVGEARPGGAVVATPVLASPAPGRFVLSYLIAVFESAGRFPSQQIVSHRWDGASWQALPAQFAGFAPGDLDGVTEEGESVSSLSMSARGDDVYLAWDHREIASPSVLVARLLDGAWQPVGPPVNVDPAGEATAPSLQIDAQARPVVVWREVIDGIPRGVLARWDGAGWAAMGGPVWSDRSPQAPRLALWKEYAPVVAWQSADGLHLSRWNGPAAPLIGMGITRVSPNGCAVAGDPATLRATGCFTIVDGHAVPHDGLLPYDVVVDEWTDGSLKRRWLAVPDGAALTTSTSSAWDGPAGTLAIQELSVEVTPGDPLSRRPVETRFLERTAAGWRALSYRWRADRSDADLLPGVTAETGTWPRGAGTYTHLYPSRDECAQCHSAVAGSLLGVRTAQLARLVDAGGVIGDQLRLLATLQLGAAAAAPALTSPLDVSAGFERRMRGYLDAQCAYCHRPGAVGASLDLRATTALADTHLCSVITPGNQDGSPLFQLVRSRSTAPPRGMPPIGSRVFDTLAVHVVGKWIASAPAELCP